jgi:hypothetical protein
MKKILAILMTICLMVNVFIVASITAFAALLTEPDAPPLDAVLRVSALKKTASDTMETQVLKDFASFQDGWNYAMEIAGDDDEMDDNKYERIVVDIYTDWKANDDGEFTEEIWNGDGFKNDTIFVPADAKVTLNLNGHTINRGLTDDIDDGEVMFINDDADIIINDGAIKGGYSNSEGGGLYIESAKVTLNNVNIIDNTVEDDDGAGIAAYGNTTLIINGGSISDNLVAKGGVEDFYGGAIYIENGTAILTGVTLKGNAYDDPDLGRLYGAVIYSDDASVTMTDCTVQENGLAEYEGVAHGSINSIIYAEDSKIVIENTDFIDNGRKEVRRVGGSKSKSNPIANSLFSINDSDLTLTGGNFTGNDVAFLIKLMDSTAYVEGVDFTDNDALALATDNDTSTPSFFINCKFGAGTSINDYYKYDFEFWEDESGVAFEDCTFNNSTFSDKNAATFFGGNVSNAAGSIFGEGSLAVIVAFVALIASVASIFVNVGEKKKKGAPVTQNKTEE